MKLLSMVGVDCRKCRLIRNVCKTKDQGAIERKRIKDARCRRGTQKHQKLHNGRIRINVVKSATICEFPKIEEELKSTLNRIIGIKYDIVIKDWNIHHYQER